MIASVLVSMPPDAARFGVIDTVQHLKFQFENPI